MRWDIHLAKSKKGLTKQENSFSNFNKAYLLSLLHQHPKEFQELMEGITEVVKLYQKGKTGKEVLFGSLQEKVK